MEVSLAPRWFNQEVEAGMLVFVYAGGTVDTYKQSYSDPAGTVLHSQPIVLQDGGEYPNSGLYLKNEQSYKLVLASPLGVHLHSVDSVIVGGSGGGIIGTTDHDALINREIADQHPTSAITGLDASLSTLGLSVSALGVSVSSIESALNDKVSKSGDVMSGSLEVQGALRLFNDTASPNEFGIESFVTSSASLLKLFYSFVNNIYSSVTETSVSQSVQCDFGNRLLSSATSDIVTHEITRLEGASKIQSLLQNISENPHAIHRISIGDNDYFEISVSGSLINFVNSHGAGSDTILLPTITNETKTLATQEYAIPRDTPALDYTGFLTPATVGMSYNPTTRKVTITANGNALYRNNVVTFANGWESPAHTDADGGYFLYYREGSIFFEPSPWAFSDLMIAFVYRDGVNVCLRECHGLMPHTAHKEFHETIGTYLGSGLDMSSLVVNSTTADNRRPLVSSGVINDEDLPTTINAITVKNDYTKLSLVGTTNPATFTQTQTDIVDLLGNQPYWNSVSGGTWGQTLFTANQYGKIFLMAIPVTDDAECQKNRLIFVQPQVVSTNLATIQDLSPSSLNLGQIAGAVPEYCFVGEIIIRYTASNWVVTSFAKLTGTKISQGSAPINTTDIQQAYNNSPDGKTTTDTTRGAVKHQRGTGADSDNVLEILNGAGDVKASIKGDGFGSFDRVRATKVRGILQDSFTIDSTDPTFSIVDTDASADAKRWRWGAQADQLFLSARNDLDTAGSDVFSVTRSGSTVTGLNVATKLTTSASTTTRAGFNVPHGTAPTTPANGDMWSTTAGLFIRINGVTKSVNLT